MLDNKTSLSEYFLENKNKDPEDLIQILNKIVDCGLIIASHVKKSGLSDAAAQTGEKNVHEDEVIKLDHFANGLITDSLSEMDCVYLLGSEEIADLHFLNKDKGKYSIFFDPLDGSSNTEANIPIGTIFSVYKRTGEDLQKGSEQIAAGYFLYGPSVMLVFSTGNGVNGFILDPASGVFLLSHPDLKIPESGKIYSINEARSPFWTENVKSYIESLKKDGSYSLRYVGSMVADVHRTLIKGGVFLYPADSKNEKGKLRLLFEVNPMSYLVVQAGGIADSNGKDPLEILPETLHEKTPIALGSPHEMKLYIKL